MSSIDPPYVYPPYKSTILRGPQQPLVHVPGLAQSMPAPHFPKSLVTAKDADLTQHGNGLPLGERMVLTGVVSDESGNPIRHSLVEIWQANASGRYDHPADNHDAPTDPNFCGSGRTMTDDEGRYRFITIRPGAYPWKNHAFAWRPAHIHFSLFGNIYAQRVITQMYFPGDPLLAIDPIYNGIPDAAAKLRLIASLELERGIEEVMLGYSFNICLAGKSATPTGL
jgi:protocatechuate 3,4-dioxygenase, beta subunit